MGNDNYSDDLHDGMDPGAEARVVDLVLGEVSGPEAEELERMIAEQPEVQAFKQQVESLHGLLGDTLVPEDDKDWKLAPERREQILEALALAGPTGKIPVMDSAAGERARERRIRRAGRRVMWSAAACFALTLFLVTLLTRPWMAFDREAGRGADDGKQFEGESQSITPDPGGLPRDAEVVESYPALADAPSGKKDNRLRRVPNQDGARRRAPEKEVSADEDLGEDAPTEGAGVPSPRPTTPEPGPKLLPQSDPVPPTRPALAKRTADKAAEGDADRGQKIGLGVVAPTAEAPAEKSTRDQSRKDLSSAAFLDAKQQQEPESELEVSGEGFANQVSEPPLEDEPGRSGDSAPTTTGEEKEGRTREVAFLGLGVLLGLFLGLAFGLGLGRTWQRRAHSSH